MATATAHRTGNRAASHGTAATGPRPALRRLARRLSTRLLTGLPLTVFMMATYFRPVPREVIEAAAIDGAGISRIFFTVAFPMVRNAVLTVALVQYFFMWNDLLIALTFTNSNNLRTVQVGLLNFTGEFGSVKYGPLFAAICITVGGTLVIFLALNQRVMKGLTGGAVKG